MTVTEILECKAIFYAGWLKEYRLSILYTRKYLHPFYFHPFHLRYQQANLILGKCQCFKVSLLYTIVSYRIGEFKKGETICKCKRAKIIRGKNNPVYSMCIRCWNHLDPACCRLDSVCGWMWCPSETTACWGCRRS